MPFDFDGLKERLSGSSLNDARNNRSLFREGTDLDEAAVVRHHVARAELRAADIGCSILYGNAVVIFSGEKPERSREKYFRRSMSLLDPHILVSRCVARPFCFALQTFHPAFSV